MRSAVGAKIWQIPPYLSLYIKRNRKKGGENIRAGKADWICSLQLDCRWSAVGDPVV